MTMSHLGYLVEGSMVGQMEMKVDAEGAAS